VRELHNKLLNEEIKNGTVRNV